MITDSKIGWGDRMGAQLSKIAQLIYICKENNQQLAFWNELKDFRRGFCFCDSVDIDNIVYLNRASKIKRSIIREYCRRPSRDNWIKEMNRTYHSTIHRYSDRAFYEWIRLNYQDFMNVSVEKDDVHTDQSLLDLGDGRNFDIHTGFGTYQDWKKYEDLIKKSIHFKHDIRSAGDEILRNTETGKCKIAVHLRRTDYLILSSLNLDISYYEKALSFFDSDSCVFLVFSDDIEECKKMELFKEKNVVFMQPNPGPIDMYLMTKCDGNIIANSSFSFWGAFLNDHVEKKVVCPHNFIGVSSPENAYINGNYYPDDWIAL